MKKKKTAPVVVRLNSTEEIFGYGYQTGETFTIENPLVIETQEGEGGDTFVFMTRLNKYTSETFVKVPMDLVFYVAPMSELINRYYDKSLALVQKEIEPRFTKGIETAIEQIDVALKLDTQGTTSEEMAFDTNAHTDEKLDDIRHRLMLSQGLASKQNH
jgi:hypothetical protein